MKSKVIPSILAIISLAGIVHATGAAELELDMLEGEFWWGGLSARGYEMPYDHDSVVSYDMYGANFGNQAQPLLLSSKGRFIWSEEPIKYTIKDGTITVTVRKGEIISGRNGDTLADAYAHVSQTFFPANGKIPDPLLFTAPPVQYVD